MFTHPMSFSTPRKGTEQMARTYLRTFSIADRIISEHDSGDETLAELIANGRYVEFADNDTVHRIIRPRRLATSVVDDVGDDTEIGTFISDHMTDDIRDSVLANDHIPSRHILDGFTKRITFVDPHAESGYSVGYTSFNAPSDRNNPHRQMAMNDLVITPPTGVSLANAIVSINGYIHRSVLFEGELYVAGAYANMKRCNMTEMALMDTTKVGGHTAVNITEEMVSAVGNSAFKNGVYITLPESYTLTDKTAFIVFHGRLFALDGFYKIISDRTIKLLLNKIDIVHWIMHHPMTQYSRRWRAPGKIYPLSAIDPEDDALSPLYDDDNPLYADPLDVNGSVTTADILTDNFIMGMLTEGQSQVIILNTKKMYRRVTEPLPTTHPGEYESFRPETPRGILWYNYQWTLPYTLTSSDSHQHIIRVNARRLGDDRYRNSKDQDVIPAPGYDTKETNRKPPVKMVEFYTP
jgi:hypothetical protein